MLLEFEHVTGNDRKFHLEDVSFSLPAGYLMGLAGKNGAGKTQKNIAYSRAIIYIPKTGDFRLQTVTLPIGRF